MKDKKRKEKSCLWFWEGELGVSDIDELQKVHGLQDWQLGRDGSGESCQM